MPAKKNTTTKTNTRATSEEKKKGITLAESRAKQKAKKEKEAADRQAQLVADRVAKARGETTEHLTKEAEEKQKEKEDFNKTHQIVKYEALSSGGEYDDSNAKMAIVDDLRILLNNKRSKWVPKNKEGTKIPEFDGIVAELTKHLISHIAPSYAKTHSMTTTLLADLYRLMKKNVTDEGAPDRKVDVSLADEKAVLKQLKTGKSSAAGKALIDFIGSNSATEIINDAGNFYFFPFTNKEGKTLEPLRRMTEKQREEAARGVKATIYKLAKDGVTMDVNEESKAEAEKRIRAELKEAEDAREAQKEETAEKKKAKKEEEQKNKKPRAGSQSSARSTSSKRGGDTSAEKAAKERQELIDEITRLSNEGENHYLVKEGLKRGKEGKGYVIPFKQLKAAVEDLKA